MSLLLVSLYSESFVSASQCFGVEIILVFHSSGIQRQRKGPVFLTKWMPFQFEGGRGSCCGIKRAGRQQTGQREWFNTASPDAFHCLTSPDATSCHYSESSVTELVLCGVFSG